MDREQDLETTRFENSGFKETRIDQQIDRPQNSNIQGSIFFSKKLVKKNLPAGRRGRPFNWIRIRSFFIKHKQFKRMMEFSCHPSGVHLLRLAVFYSESGCGMCKVYVEKNLF